MKIKGFVYFGEGIWYEKNTGLPWTTRQQIRDSIGYGFTTVFNGELKRLNSLNSDGYYSLRFKGKTKKWHRLVWEFFKGEIQKNKVIDHISNDCLDCRIENLQLLSSAQNIKKCKIYKHNTTGFAGVTYLKKTGKYMAQIVDNYKTFYIGCSFNTPEEAYKAYYAAKIKYHGVESVSFLPKPD